MAVNVELKNLNIAIATTMNVIRQWPYATANAMNRTAKESVDAGRVHIAEHFQIRKPFIINRLRILQYARPGGLTSTIGVDARVQGSPLLLGFFEEGQGGQKLPTHGSGIAIPLTGGPARPAFPSSVPASWRYQSLDLTDRKGVRRTFVVPGVGVFQRVGPGGRVYDRTTQRFITVDKTKTALVYLFRSSAPLNPRMQLKLVIAELWAERFPEIFSEEFTREIMKRSQHIASKVVH